MRSQERNDADSRPEFDCRFDPDSGEIDEQCVRDYLRSHMPLAA